MNEDIMRMAIEAGCPVAGIGPMTFDDKQLVSMLEHFAALVASAEREACANICETLELPEWPDKVRQPLAQAIRARGQV